jgi:hypothetical protein
VRLCTASSLFTGRVRALILFLGFLKIGEHRRFYWVSSFLQRRQVQDGAVIL